MAPNSPACSFIHASTAGSRSTAPSNRSNSVLIISLLSAFESCGYVTEGLPVTRSHWENSQQLSDTPQVTTNTLSCCTTAGLGERAVRSEEHTSELQSLTNLVCRL